MTRDRLLIYAAAFLRSVAVGSVGVFAAIDLRARGLTVTTIGIVIGAGMAGGAMTTLLVGARADEIVGRRRLLMLLGGLGAFGYVAMTWSMPAALLIGCAFLGTVNAMGRDRGGLSALEQAMLPDTAPAEQRTWALAWYNLVLDVGHAVGALGGAMPTLVASAWHIDEATAHRLTFGLCAVLLGSGVLFYGGLSPGVERQRSTASVSRPPISGDTRRRVRALATLFALDSLGGGFLGSALVAYWFFERYGLTEGQIATLFSHPVIRHAFRFPSRFVFRVFFNC